MAETIPGFAERLHDLLAQRQWTQTKLAKMTGLHIQAIYKFIKGDRSPSFLNAIKLCHALGCSLDYLAGVDAIAMHNNNDPPEDDPTQFVLTQEQLDELDEKGELYLENGIHIIWH